jgi:hypothetical protein
MSAKSMPHSSTRPSDRCGRSVAQGQHCAVETSWTNDLCLAALLVQPLSVRASKKGVGKEVGEGEEKRGSPESVRGAGDPPRPRLCSGTVL